MSATWSWKSNGDSAVVRKTDDGLVPGAAITAINNNTNPLQYITGTGGVTIDNSTPGTTQISGGGAVQTVTNNATVLSASIASNRLTLGYSGTPLPVVNGGTGNISLITTPTTNTIPSWDSNGNLTTQGLITNQINITANTKFLPVNLPGKIYIASSAANNFQIILPDVNAGGVTPGFETTILNENQTININVVTNNQIAGPAATFTASCIAGTTMVVTAVSSGTLAVGQTLSGPFIYDSPTITVSAGGGTGTYTISATENFTSQTCQTYTNPPILLTSLTPNEVKKFIFVTNSASPYWNFYSLGTSLNDLSQTYQFQVTSGSTPSASNGSNVKYWSATGQNLYLDANPNNKLTQATSTGAQNVVVYADGVVKTNALTGMDGCIFLPDPGTTPIGYTFNIFLSGGNFINSGSIRIFDYTQRAVYETALASYTNAYTLPNDGFYIGFGFGGTNSYTLYSAVNISKIPGTNEWVVYEETPSLGSLEQTILLLTSLITLIPGIYPAVSIGATIAGMVLPSLCSINPGSVPSVVKMEKESKLRNGSQTTVSSNAATAVQVKDNSGTYLICTIPPGATMAINLMDNSLGPGNGWNVQLVPGINSITGAVIAKQVQMGSTLISSSASPVTLTSSSPHVNIVTGSANQTVLLPVITTINIGTMFNLTSNTSGTLTVQANNGSGASAGVLTVLPNGGKCTVTCIAQNNVVGDWSINTIGTGNIVQATNYASGFTSSGTANIILNSFSNCYQRLTTAGTNQFVFMPDVTTIAIGTGYQIYNNAGAFTATIKSFAGNIILSSIPIGACLWLFSLSNTDNSAGGWEVIYNGTVISGLSPPYQDIASAPSAPLQYRRSTNSAPSGSGVTYSNTWDYAYQPVDSAYWNPTFQENGVTRTITQLCFYYVNTFFSGTAGATTKMVHCQLGVNVTAYGGASGTGPYTITLPFTSSQTIDFPIGVVKGGNACCFAQIVSGNNYLTVLNTPGYTTTGGDTWTASFFYNV